MPDRTMLLRRGGVAVVLILLAAAGTRAAWPSVNGSWPGGGRVAVVGGVTELVLAALLITLRWHRPALTAPGPGEEDLAARMRRLLNAALIVALIGVPVLVLLTEVKLSQARPAPPPPPSKLGKHHPSPRPLPHYSSFRIPPLVLYLIVAALIAVLIVLALRAWLYQRGRSVRAEVPDLDVELTEDELARAVESGQAALLEIDDARLAIIRCYLAMEHSLAQAGAVRGEAETPDELLARAVAADLVARAPASLLTSLFYEARFSTHPMPPAKRDQARGALSDLAAELPSRTPPAG